MGTGAVIRALVDAGWTGLSPEAWSAAAAFDAVVGDLAGALRACTSGTELRGIGYPVDVDIAAEIDDSDAVPVLRDGVFTQDERVTRRREGPGTGRRPAARRPPRR